MQQRFSLLCLAAVMVSNAHAITRRHDVSDSQLTSLASTSFSAMGILSYSNAPTDKRSCVLIGDKFILTAAHNVPATGVTANIHMSGQDFEAVSWVKHPSYNPSALENGFDVAVARLNRRVIDQTPFGLFSGTNDAGMQCWLVGFGGTGSGNTGVISFPWINRAGTNTIEVDPLTPNIALCDFDSGLASHNSLSSIGSTATMTPLESCLAPGDSGGGMFVFQDGVYKVAGVLSARYEVDGLLDSDYADVSVISRTGSLASWIKDKAHENGRVAGHISLKDYIPTPLSVFATFEIRNPGSTTALEVGNVDLAVDGGFSFQTTKRGTYDITVKCPHWLRSKWSNVSITNNGPVNLEILLTNGDVDGDNEVGPGDFGALSSAFGTVNGDANWNTNADLDGDGEVGPSDFGILSAHFGLSGEA